MMGDDNYFPYLSVTATIVGVVVVMIVGTYIGIVLVVRYRRRPHQTPSSPKNISSSAIDQNNNARSDRRSNCSGKLYFVRHAERLYHVEGKGKGGGGGGGGGGSNNGMRKTFMDDP
eukprot:PhF_6_TR44490/c0_g2_i2/m.68519